MMLKTPFIKVRSWLNQPQKIMIVCFLFFILNFIINGNFFRLWNLNREHTKIENNIEKTKLAIVDLDLQLKEAKKPEFIEKLAREKLDLVEQDDLIFIFSDDNKN